MAKADAPICAPHLKTGNNGPLLLDNSLLWAHLHRMDIE